MGYYKLLKKQALDLIKSKEDGVYQNSLWKEMNIDSRKCSRIISYLIKDGLITREKTIFNGARTYLLKAIEKEKEAYRSLITKDVFSPCAGCKKACQPEYCNSLTEWISLLDANTS